MCYDLKNRLVKIEKKNGAVIEYGYDALDQRITMTESDKTTKYLMSGMVEYARNDGSKSQYHTLGLDLAGSLKRTGAVGAVLASSSADGKDSFNYLYDGNGNVIATADNTGKIISKLAYEPFGKQTTNLNLPFSFSTKAVDNSEMSYYGYRFYIKNIARWEKRDPINEFGGINIYLIAINRILNRVDIKGMISIERALHNEIAVNAEYAFIWENLGLSGFSDYAKFEAWYKWDKAEGTSWLNGLPNCPNRICITTNGKPVSCNNGQWDSISQASQTYHPGAKWEMRSSNYTGAGQQCTFDAQGYLIRNGSSAGTPDKSAASVIGGLYLNHYYEDVEPYELAVKVSWVSRYLELRPPNQGGGQCYK